MWADGYAQDNLSMHPVEEEGAEIKQEFLQKQQSSLQRWSISTLSMILTAALHLIFYLRQQFLGVFLDFFVAAVFLC